MAVYGVSPYALPPDVALGCMMNLRMANAWKAIPQVLAVGVAFGNKQSSNEFTEALRARKATDKMAASELIEYLKSKEDR